MWHLRAYGLALAAIALCATHAGHAAPASSGAIEQRKEQLKFTQSQMDALQQQRRKAKEALKDALQARRDAQQELLDKAAYIDRIERDLLKQQEELATLRKQEARQHALLNQQRTRMSRVVRAAWSLHHRPHLAAWMLPEQARERALLARGVQMTSHAIKHEMQILADALRQQQALRDDIMQRKTANETLYADATQERASLLSLLKQRQQLVATLQSKQVAYQEKMAELAKGASNLEQLIGSLEVARAKQIDAQYDGITPLPKPVWPLGQGAIDDTPTPAQSATQRTPLIRGDSFIASKGSLPLPARGTVTGRFNERRGNNDRLKGIEMRTLAAATVSTPYEGEVLYTGAFLNYGKMVIIRHSHDYHTLIAGLSRIDVARGQFLLDGEPIGAMGENSNMRKLYMELRRNSQAIDPKPWFASTEQHYATN